MKEVKERNEKLENRLNDLKEQIEELIAEGIEPQDQEYNRYLLDHGIKPEKAVKEEKDNNQEKQEELKNKINELKKQMKESAKKMAEYRKEGFYEQEAAEHMKYNKIMTEMNQLEEELTKLQKTNENSEEIKWHPELTQEQIEELIAEGLRPEDPEYDEYLWNHGIKPIKEQNKIEKPGKGLEKNQEPTNENPKIKEEDGKNNKNLPIRSFWEIYNSTCTQKIGGIANKIHQFAHMKILPNKEEDTMQKVLSAPLIPMKGLMKVLSFIPNKIMRTDKKFEEIQENIENLTTKEFMVLVHSPERANELFGGKKIKAEYDRDYLEPQLMKQYKVNDAYLRVVGSRLSRENTKAIMFYNEHANEEYDKIQKLEQIGRIKWTPEQEKEYNMAVEDYQTYVERGKELREEIDTFNEGAEKKSSKHRNISGWILAKFNPDNREENAKMAALSKARREAAELGDSTKMNQYTTEMQKFGRVNTKIKGSKRNNIDIGKYSVPDNGVHIEGLNAGEQNKGRLLLTDIALVSSIKGLYDQVRRNIANRKMVAEHNEHLKQVNSQNKNLEVKGEAKVADSPTAPQTEEAITKQTVNAGFNQAERGNLGANGFHFTKNYHKNDVLVHSEATKAANEAGQLLKDGKNLEALKTATKYYTKVQGEAGKVLPDYISSHSHDYTAYDFGSTADMKAVSDFFEKGVVPYETSVNGVMANMMQSLKEGLDLNGVILAGANSLYQAQKDALKNKFKNNLVKSAKTPVNKEKIDKDSKQEQPSKEAENENER